MITGEAIKYIMETHDIDWLSASDSFNLAEEYSEEIAAFQAGYEAAMKAALEGKTPPS